MKLQNRRCGPLFGLLLALAAPLGAAPIHWTAVLAAGSGHDDGARLDNWDNARWAVQRCLAGAPVDWVLFTSQAERVGTFEGGAVVQRLTREALRSALAGLPPGPDEGLVLFLTSHGSRGAGWVFEDDGTGQASVLSPQDLAAWLAASVGSRSALVLISSCFSGQFLEVGGIPGPHRVVLTAARADRSSFGCGSGTALPEWDESLTRLWAEAGGDTPWATLAEAVAADIGGKEATYAERSRSYPQASVGSEVDFSISLAGF